MKKTFGFILIAFGLLSIISSSVGARTAPNLSYLIGTFLPGWMLLIFGLAVCRAKKLQIVEPSTTDEQRVAEHAMKVQLNQLETRANLAVSGGIAAMFMGSALAQQGPELFLAGSAASLCGWGLIIWGCVNYMRWKGYSGWLGLFGYLLLFGLIILYWFPNKRKRVSQTPGCESVADIDVVLPDRQRSRYLFPLAFAPLGVLFLILGSFVYLSRADIPSDQWTVVAQPEVGFQALMPGTFRLVSKTEEAPAGKVELHKYIVEPKGKKELFMIISVRFPEAADFEFSGTEQLLALGRKDLLSASQAQLKDEREIVLAGCPGLELEALPQDGGIVKARIYVRKNQVYQVSAHVPKIRLTSNDIRKFLDSFTLSVGPSNALDRSGD